MTVVCSVSVHSGARGGALSYLFNADGDDSTPSWGYLLVSYDIVKGVLRNQRTVGCGCGFADRAEAIQAGNDAARLHERAYRFTWPELLAGDRLQAEFDAPLRKQIDANRRDPHCEGVY